MRRLLAAAAGLACAAAAPLYLDGPPPAHTGGFGERTCAACHFDVPEPDPAGGAEVRGLPSAGYSPGTRYLITVRLSRPGMRAGGYQLSARFPDGSQAGTLTAVDPRSRVAPAGAVQYAQHTRDAAVSRDSAAWVVQWTAPRAGTVHLHLAANAADGDESPLGDHVYSGEASLAPAP